MKKHVEKLVTRARRILILAYLALVLSIGVICISQFLSFGVWYAMLMLFMATGITLFIIYLAKFRWLKPCLKIFKENNIWHYLDDIDLTVSTFGEDKIYCGENAFFCAKYYAIIPYSEIAWIHPYNESRRESVFHLKNGKKIIIAITQDNLFYLINSYIINKNPDLLEGDNSENKLKYNEQHSIAFHSQKTSKAAIGIALMIFSIFILILNYINQNLDGSLIIIVAIIFSIGLAVFLIGKYYLQFKERTNNLLHHIQNSSILNIICKIATVISIVSAISTITFGSLGIEPLMIVAIIGYLASVIPFLASIFLRCGFFQEKKRKVFILPNDRLDDVSYILQTFVEDMGNLFSYQFVLSFFYDWKYVEESVEYMLNSDISDLFNSEVIGEDAQKKLILKGMSNCLYKPIQLLWVNQTNSLFLFMPDYNVDLAKRYVETMLRRNFGTKDELKRTK